MFWRTLHKRDKRDRGDKRDKRPRRSKRQDKQTSRQADKRTRERTAFGKRVRICRFRRFVVFVVSSLYHTNHTPPPLVIL